MFNQTVYKQAARQQETKCGTLVIVDTNQGDYGFYRKILRRVVLINTGTHYYMSTGKNVISEFGAFEYNHHAGDGPSSRFRVVERQANEAFDAALIECNA
ncbi:MAG: hypothetical protein M0Z50_00965 [Planctomycetia bacterium]|jgi:hypothetical protein|nr:hypothetical protein [Planctomycetia bacterium]